MGADVGQGVVVHTASVRRSGLRLILELLPLVLFFVAYRLDGIYTATGVLMAGMTFHAGYMWLQTGRLSAVQGGMTLLVWIFGGATLILRDPDFIKLKPTVLNWILALVFFFSAWGRRPPLVQRLLGGQVALFPPQWEVLNRAWVVFFIFSGGLNLWIAWRYDESVWVHFKMFGSLGLMLVFLLVQGIWLARQVGPERSPADDADAWR
ncbi:MAG: septation protein IspZ [Magnetococcales bacterium]|nr:septation protein IspZ [Magnetococcales bacterium]MBF0322204.1 septation protein IspZ [Magnetococcales bacterium]